MGCFCFVIAVIVAFLTPCFASSIEDEPSEKYIDLCDGLFNGNNQTAMETSIGFDITLSFCDTYEQGYIAGEYGVLWDAVLENEYMITSVSSTPTLAPRLVIPGTLQKNFYRLLKTKTFVWEKGFEVGFSLMCSYRYNDSTGQIETTYGPTVLYDVWCNAGALFPHEIDFITVDAYLTNNRKTLNSGVAFDLILQYAGGDIPGMIWWEESFSLSGDASVTPIP